MILKKASIFLIAIVLVAGIGLYAIKGGVGGDSTQATSIPPGSMPPLTLVPVSLPDYAQQTEEISGAYTIATQIPDVLEKMPCYCSCGEVGHKNLKNCYIRDDGTFDRHGSACQLCIDEAYDIYEWYREGVPLEEIRNRIDRAYGTGYGTGTDTPPV